MIVHILRGGRAMCGMLGIPRDWPEDHRWVKWHEAKDATCKRCLTLRADELGEGQRRSVRSRKKKDATRHP